MMYRHALALHALGYYRKNKGVIGLDKSLLNVVHSGSCFYTNHELVVASRRMRSMKIIGEKAKKRLDAKA